MQADGNVAVVPVPGEDIQASSRAALDVVVTRSRRPGGARRRRQATNQLTLTEGAMRFTRQARGFWRSHHTYHCAAPAIENKTKTKTWTSG